ncbi:helix-turn-helix domain-containing protein, partial [bacterium]|nr:helix-turn-helix domain-containing protein [bacterium]
TTPSDPPSLAPATHDLLRGKARQVVRRCWLPAADRDDVEQDLAAHVWPRLGRYDAARSDREVFVRMLVARAAATVIRRRRVRRVTDPLATALLLGEGDAPDPRSWPTREEAAARALDVAAVVAALPPRLRRTARAVAGGTVASAARALGLTRQQVYAHLAEMRGTFAAAGLAPEENGRPRKPRGVPTRRARPG